jgi:hypothetical protein
MIKPRLGSAGFARLRHGRSSQEGRKTIFRAEKKIQRPGMFALRRGAARCVDTPEPLTPGVPVTLRFSLTPQPVVLKPGERLRLDIGSRTDLLRSDASHGHAQFDMQVPPYYSRKTLHYGPDSFLEVRVANSSAKTG